MVENLRPAIFCDFDGTLTEIDVTDQILAQLAHPSWREVEQEWVRGTIGSEECLERQMALVDASEGELNALIDAIPVDPGFRKFYRFAEKRGIPFYIVSDGFDYVIRRVLRNSGLRGPLRNGTHIFSSNLEHRGRQVRTAFPLAGCSHGCATCKAAVIRQLRPVNSFVIFIGDGLSDRFAAEEADLVFAKHQLLAYCRENQVDCRPFETFGDVEATLEKSLRGARLGWAKRKVRMPKAVWAPRAE